ncbi:MAG: hypothetical protein JWR26_3094 [Pedosphaera sp.]|nr:hypothetical protein [Pedosphaera sp.]
MKQHDFIWGLAIALLCLSIILELVWATKTGQRPVPAEKFLPVIILFCVINSRQKKPN